MIVYTTVFGKTDPLHEPRCKSGWRFVCFTDQNITARRWEVVRVPTLERPARECRRLKLLPHLTFPQASISLWIDCCFTLLVSPEVIAERHPGDFTAFRHPRRQRISDEAQAIIRAGKARPGAVLAQLAAYQSAGFDTDANPQQVLHNGGFLLRRHTPATAAHAERWHAEVQAHTLRDQMSLDYSAQQTGFQIDDFPGLVSKNRYAKLNHYHTPVNDY